MRHILEKGRERVREGKMERRRKESNCKATPTGIICLHNIGYWIGSSQKEMGISMKFVRHNTHSKKKERRKRISLRKFMQATNSKHMSCACGRRGRSTWNQSIVYLLSVTCLFFFSLPFPLCARLWCHLPLRKETTQI